MSKYLVTGGAGFIGSHIVDRLVSNGHEVRVVDNLSTGKLENIKHHLDKVEFIQADLSDYSVATEAVMSMDYVLHQAALSSVPLSVSDPVSVNNSIVNSTVNILKAAVQSKSVKRVVQASSAAVYGNIESLPIKEDMDTNPLSPYAVAKLAQEYYGRVFYGCYGLEVISLRYFNVFGPRQDSSSSYAGVIPIFINSMINGISPVIYGDGMNCRDFVYVDNIVDANLLACHSEWNKNLNVINIGSGIKISLNELIEAINNILGTNFSPIYQKNREGDIRYSVADISKAQNLVGYHVNVNFHVGLEKLIKWWNSRNQ